MRAVQIAEYGGPEVLTPNEVADPEPGSGELLVEVGAAGVNYIDTYHRTGVYPLRLPLIPGLEGAGTVVATGSDVDEVAVGDRVAWADAIGSYAQQTLVSATKAVPVPSDVDDETAAASMLQGMTAHYLVNSTYPLAAGETILIHAGAGGMGLVLTQLAKARGARVITTVSSDEKAQLSRSAGADEVIRYDQNHDIAGTVRELTDGDGVSVAYDGVGATTFDASLAALRRRGMLVLFGAASGPVPPVDPQRLNQAGSAFLTRPKLGDYTATPDELTWRAGEVLGAVRTGTLAISIGGRYRLDEAAKAHEDLQGRRTTGKLLLLPAAG